MSDEFVMLIVSDTYSDEGAVKDSGSINKDPAKNPIAPTSVKATAVDVLPNPSAGGDAKA